MKKLFSLTGLVFVIYAGFGQQLNYTSQYLEHNSMYNPAAAGIANNNLVGVSYRNQWNSFPGNPKTYMIYGDFALNKLSAGIGAYIYRDESGPTSRTGIQLAYSYHIRTGNTSRLAMGIELKGLQFAINKSKLNDALGSSDPLLWGSSSKIAVDAGAGVYWTNDKLSAGIAVSQLLHSKIELAYSADAAETGKLYRHYNFIASYKIQAGDNVFVIPNLMAMVIEHAPSEFTFGAKINYQDKLWWALNWRVRQIFSIQAGFMLLKRISLNYSYDYYETPINLFSAGSSAHEIGLQFFLKKK